MGLLVSHGCWSGSYRCFGLWRRALARKAGIPVELMEGWFDMRSFDDLPKYPKLSYMSYAELLPIKWSALRPDPLHVLLDHSDCDGEIAVADLLPLADRLEELVPGLNDARWPWLEGATREFIVGLRRAAASGDPVVFE